MGSGFLRLGVSLGLAAIGFMVAGPEGAQIGFLAGSVLGAMIFPQKSDIKMPKVGEYPVQRSGKGTAIPIICGTIRAAGNIIWLGDLQSYVIAHKSSGGGGKGMGGEESVSYETKYRRSFLIGICEGPATIRRSWKGKELMDILLFTQYSGVNNIGISILLGEKYATYKNMCCAYFEDFELGNAQALPNFVFEVSAGIFEDLILHELSMIGGNEYIYKTIDNKDGTFTEAANVSQGPDGGLAIGYSGEHAYMKDGLYLEKFDIDLNPVVAWQDSGRKLVVNISTLLPVVDKANGNVLIAASKVLSLLDSDGDEIWNTDIDLNTAWLRGNFTRAGDILACRKANTGDAGAYKLSKADGSVLAEYGDDTLYLDRFADMMENPATGDMIVVGRYRSVDGIFCFPATGGGVNELKWSSAIVAPTYPQCVGCLLDGSIFVGGPTATNPVGTLHKYTAGGSYVGSYNTGHYVMDVIQQDYNNIVVGGYRGTNEDGATVALSILNTDLEYQRGHDFGVNRDIWNIAVPVVPVIDANPAIVIKDLLTHTRYGAGLDESTYLNIDSFDDVAYYCDNNNLKISLVINEQKPLWDWIDYICSHFGGYRYRSGGKICLGIFRDESAIFTLTQDNLVISDSKDSSPPVQIRKRKYTETYNRIEIQWTDRDADYDTAIAVANDEVDQRISGQVRKRTINLAGITDATYAQKMAYRMLIESMYRHSFYAFTLAYKDMLLEVNDVGTISDGFLLTDEKIRITSVSEDKDGKGLIIEAIEDGSRLYPDIAYASQQTERTPPAAITLVNARIIFREDLNDRLLHLSVIPGNTSVNGYNIYRSYDDSSYVFIGRATVDGITGGDSNSYGTLMNNLPAYPSVVYRGEDTILVDIGTVTDLNTAIADDTFFDGRKILKIGNEIIGYHNCEETSVVGIWKITGLIRGMYNTLPVAHSVGDALGTLDVDFTYILSESDIGKVLYFKAQVFYANRIEDISDVTAYGITVSGKSRKPLPISLMRINGREGLITYRTDDVTMDWYFCSKVSGCGRGGYGNALWGAYLKDPILSQFKIELEEEDGTPIMDEMIAVDTDGEPNEYIVTAAKRNGKNPVRVKITPASHLLADETREILIENI